MSENHSTRSGKSFRKREAQGEGEEEERRVVKKGREEVGPQRQMLERGATPETETGIRSSIGDRSGPRVAKEEELSRIRQEAADSSRREFREMFQMVSESQAAEARAVAEIEKLKAEKEQIWAENERIRAEKDALKETLAEIEKQKELAKRPKAHREPATTKRNPTEDEVMTALCLLHEGTYDNLTEAQMGSGIGRRLLKAADERCEADLPLFVPQNNEFWTKEMDDLFTLELEAADMHGRSLNYLNFDPRRHTPGDLKPEEVDNSVEKMVHMIHCLVAQKYKKEPLSAYESRMCSHQVLKKILKNNKAYELRKIKAIGDRQNLRRAEALADAYNFASLAVQAEVVFPESYLQELVFNYDKSTIYLNQDCDGEIVSLKLSARKLGKRHRNIKICQSVELSRMVR